MSSKKLICRILRVITFFLTSIIWQPIPSISQTGPIQYRYKFSEQTSLLTKYFSTLLLPDSTRQIRIKFKCDFSGKRSPVFLAVTNSSMILLFSDSSLSEPFLLEKRIYFPFRQLKSNSRYCIEVNPSTGKDGYLAIRLLHVDSKEILDEVFLCFPETDLVVPGLSMQSQIWAKPD